MMGDTAREVLTPAQFTLIWQAVDTVNRVRREEGYEQLGERVPFRIDAAKSRLLGRILFDGRDPLPGPAKDLPHYAAGVHYAEVEPDLDHFYLTSGMTPFRVTVVIEEPRDG